MRKNLLSALIKQTLFCEQTLCRKVSIAGTREKTEKDSCVTKLFFELL